MIVQVQDHELRNAMARSGLTESVLKNMQDIEALILKMKERGIQVMPQVSETQAGEQKVTLKRMILG
jgi:hypothetical protein